MNPIDAAARRIARLRFEAQPGVSLARDAKVAVNKVTLKKACHFRVGDGSVVEATLDFEREGAALLIGANSYVGASTFKCAYRIEVGDDVEIAWNCSIVDHDWESLVFSQRRTDKRRWYVDPKDWSHVPHGEVHIGNGALIGFNSVILKGVHIGEGAVVGVQSVVTRDVPAWTVVAGAPARLVRRLEVPPARSGRVVEQELQIAR